MSRDVQRRLDLCRSCFTMKNIELGRDLCDPCMSVHTSPRMSATADKAGQETQVPTSGRTSDG